MADVNNNKLLISCLKYIFTGPAFISQSDDTQIN